MKNFLSKYWKRILILIAGIFIVINLVSKCIAPHTLVQEYAKYAPDVASTSSSGDNSTSASDIIADVKEASPFSDDIFKVISFVAIGLVVALVIAEVTTKKNSGGKKK